MSANGVVIGIVKLVSGAMTGGVLAVIVIMPPAGHGLVGRLFWICSIEAAWKISIECGATSTDVMPA